MRRIAAITGAMIMLALPAQAAPAGLIGKWVLVPEAGRSCPVVGHVFAATTETTMSGATYSFPASNSTTPVRYVGDAHEVYAIGPGGPSRALRYEIKDANHITESSFSGCTYQRAR